MEQTNKPLNGISHTANVGDIIGCGIRKDNVVFEHGFVKPNQQLTVFFTLNHKEVNIIIIVPAMLI